MRSLRCFLAAAAFAVSAAGLSATTVVPPEFEELVQSSDYIIRGRVVSLTNEVRVREGREVPFTLVEIAVSELIAGEAPERVVLSMLGGKMSDGSELRVEGVPQFTVGDEDILFVQGNGTNFHPLNAVMHGRYPVKFDKELGRAYIARANGVPLATTAEIALPLAEGKVARLLRDIRSRADALTPAEFTASIRESRTVEAKIEGDNVHAK